MKLHLVLAFAITAVATPAMADAPAKTKTKQAKTTTALWTQGDAELEIRSPNVFGEVWVNNRRLGYPPIVAKTLGTGHVTVEVRVGNTSRSTSMVKLKDGHRSKLVLLRKDKAVYFAPSVGNKTSQRAQRLRLKEVPATELSMLRKERQQCKHTSNELACLNRMTLRH